MFVPGEEDAEGLLEVQPRKPERSALRLAEAHAWALTILHEQSSASNSNEIVLCRFKSASFFGVHKRNRLLGIQLESRRPFVDSEVKYLATYHPLREGRY